ncbi:MAG: FAD-dependent oxidoreductase [Planctomycetota bacterium]|nr:FAD-dependent oxidoreductase [Planctomycetota bacterium]
MIAARHLFGTLLVFFTFVGHSFAEEYDVVVYGGTSAAVTAAVQAKRMGKTTIIVCPDKHLGGLSSGGLGWTDTGNKAVIGGLAREFYHRVWQHYDKPETWKWQTRESYGNKGQGTAAIDGEQRTMWIFEPHVAEAAFEDMIRDNEIPVHRDEWLDRENGVKRDGARITSITMLSGKTYAGRMFIDATYEGDLMAAAGVDYHVGRESKDKYGEEWNGVQTGVLHHGHHFGAVKQKISPYLVPGDPSSGVLPRISTEPPGEYGAADDKVQAYCFRMCLTNHAENLVPFPKPAQYDPAEYELLLRILKAGWREGFGKFDPIPNYKTDVNNHGPMSTDNIGFNYDYPEASYERRREIIREHETYQKGWLYFIANDPRVPKEVQDEMRRWGLAKDEFAENGNWPHQLYIREARRMIGEFVLTENELLKKRPTPDSIGMGSYTMDSHNVQRYITPEGFVQNEGDIGVSTHGPYQIAYGSIVPKRGQCDNLLVPVCLSSSHIAFGSIRMEPVFMILGHSAAAAAVIAIDGGTNVQDVAYAKLREQLLKDGQVLKATGLDLGGSYGQDPAKFAGIVVDDTKATTTGQWTASTSSKTWIGQSYRHDGDQRDGKATSRFETKLPESGTYEVRLGYTPHSNRASNVSVEVYHAGGQATVTVNQKRQPPIDDLFVSLGKYEFHTDKPAAVVVSNRNADGYVIIDAVQWVRVE